MAYAPATSQPNMVTQRVGTNGGAFWVYNSADAATAGAVVGLVVGFAIVGIVLAVQRSRGTTSH